MKIVMSAASGYIGTALVPALRADGHEVVRLVRRETRAGDEVRWDPAKHELDPAQLSGADAVIHLSGANIGDRRWTKSFKRTLVDSRVDSTETIAAAITTADAPPPVLISASGINYYGDCGDRLVDESAPAGTGFFAELCRKWEDAAEPAQKSGTRAVRLRSGPVYGPGGGLLKPLRLLFKLGCGGRLGSGQQYMPWISLRDQVDAIRFLLTADGISGPVNLVGPEPATNADFTKAMAAEVHRPAVLPVPGFALRAVTGELADEAILASVRAVPAVLLEHGYTFHDPDIRSALRWALG